MKDGSPASEISRTADSRPARARIDLEAVLANHRVFAKLAGPAECAAVLKADAYGLGADAAGPKLAAAGVRTFFTATLGEGRKLRRAIGAGPRIYVLNGVEAADAETYGDLTPVLNSLAQIKAWRSRGPAALHIDTGMNRLGLGLDDVGAAQAALPTPELVISHLACASLQSHSLNKLQRRRFVEAAGAFPNAKRSLAATAGVQLGAEYCFDMARIGVGLYGAADAPAGPALSTTATVEAPILAVREVPAGESVGYGATIVTHAPITIATVAIGYADGFLRSLAGRGYGVVGGQKRPILGRVSMDLVILDVTDCEAARPGAWVQFLGPEAPLDEVAAAASTNPYEILTTLVGTVRRGGA